MLSNKFFLATTSILVLSSSTLFAMEEGEESPNVVRASRSSEAAQTQPFLDPKDRPESTKRAIDRAFAEVSSGFPAWSRENGSEHYGLCGVDDEKIVKHILSSASPEQKKFLFMDLGDGQGQWGRHKVNVINNLENFPEGAIVHIFSLRGDYGPTTEEIIGRCILHTISMCKIEELSEVLRSYKIENKVDLIVSHWCFRHLADPLGTFVQTYNFLRPETGLLLMDGFAVADEMDVTNFDPNLNLLVVLQETKAPFLMLNYNIARSLNHFALKRPDNEPCQLHMSYIDTIPIKGQCQIESKVVTSFLFNTTDLHTTDPKLAEMYQSMLDNQFSNNLYGDKELFSFFSKNELINKRFTFGGSNK